MAGGVTAREIRVLPDAEAASRAAADEVARQAQEAVRARGRFTLGLAGGRTPRRLYELLAERRDRVPWDRVHFFWGDERCVPPDDPRSNYRLARETLLDRLSVGDDAIHRVRGELDPEAAAADYDARLSAFFDRPEATPPALDLVLLGTGTDGHTASIFPGDSRDDDPRWARPSRAPVGVEPVHRVTLTLRTLNACRRALFLATGPQKAHVVARARDAGPCRPAGPPPPTGGADAEGSRTHGLPPALLVCPPDGVLWLVDRSAGPTG